MGNDSSAGSCAQDRQKPGSPPDAEYMTLGELATWLRISRSSAWSLLLEKQEIPYLRFADRTIRIPKDEVLAFINRSRSDATD